MRGQLLLSQIAYVAAGDAFTAASSSRTPVVAVAAAACSTRAPPCLNKAANPEVTALSLNTYGFLRGAPLFCCLRGAPFLERECMVWGS